MQNPIKGPLRRRFKAVLSVLREEYTILWRTKSTGVVYTKGETYKTFRHRAFEFESQEQLIKWLETQGEKE